MTRSKTIAAWLALLGGTIGLHRLYLKGLGDVLGWLHVLPTSLGLFGVMRLREIGQDDRLAWIVTIPASAFIAAVFYALSLLIF